MMPQIDIKIVFDFLQKTLPLVSGIIMAIGGWVFSLKIVKLGFKNEIMREQHKELRNSFVNTNSLFTEFYEYVYSFINKTKDSYLKKIDMNDYELDEISSKKMIKINLIFNIINNDFPEINSNYDEYINISNRIDQFYTDLRSIKDKYDKIEKYIGCITEVSNSISQLTKISNELLNKVNNHRQRRWLEWGSLKETFL
jgi:hypothetical protein